MSTVLFDFGGVISYRQPASDLAALAEAARAPVDGLWEAYWRTRIAYDAGDLDAIAFWRNVGASVGRTFEKAEIARLVQLDVGSWLHLQPGTIGLIEDLAAVNVHLALLSNAPVEVAEAVAALPLSRRFDHLIFSCHLRTVKPDDSFFAAALNILGVHASEAAFLDDSEPNVAAASRLGIRAMTFTDPSSARAWLATILNEGDNIA